MTVPATFKLPNSPALGAVLSDLSKLGFSETGLRARLGLRDLTDLNWRALPIYRDERLNKRDLLDLAIDLFHLQAVLPADELARLLSPTTQQTLKDASLIEIDTEGAGRATASLYPVGDVLIFSDHAWPQMPHPGQTAVPHNQVMFIGHDSRHLAHCTPRRKVDSALDLCTGSGVHALLAAQHAQRVLAVDISPRAVDCTRFNAQALQFGNVKAAVGDLFEPAGDERFDLITANPPFVPSPVDTLGFRDGGRSGEDVQQRIVAGLPSHLTPRGSAHIVTELGERDGEPLADRLRMWLGTAPIDIHILRLREYSATNYAVGHAHGDGYGEFLESVRHWSANLREQGYDRVVSVILTFQWSDPAFGPPWHRSDEATAPIRAAAGDIEALFQAERTVRDPRLAERLETGLLRRTGPVALVDAKLLGGVNVSAKATLLGQALAIEHPLTPIEREVLYLLEEPVTLPDLVTHAATLDPGSVIRAAVSLLRKRLATLVDSLGD